MGRILVRWKGLRNNLEMLCHLSAIGCGMVVVVIRETDGKIRMWMLTYTHVLDIIHSFAHNISLTHSLSVVVVAMRRGM